MAMDSTQFTSDEIDIEAHLLSELCSAAALS